MKGGLFGHALYRGWVGHTRYLPREHRFRYRIELLALDLDELDSLQRFRPWLSREGLALARFKDADYLGEKTWAQCPELSGFDGVTPRLDPSRVWQAVLSLGGVARGGEGRVILVCPVRQFGLYFSPVNFYFCHNAQDELDWVLVEVSNTPWNERHLYLIDPDSADETDKVFHVSPFFNKNMSYRWRLAAPDTRLNLGIENYGEQKLFSASLNLKRYSLSRSAIRRHVLVGAAGTLRTLGLIHWQALKLFLKRIPFVPYSGAGQ